MKKYYNFKRLFHLKDKNGKTPSVYMVTNNRSAGKTTGILFECLSDFIKEGKQFILLYRTMSELEDTDLLFQDVIEMYFPDSEVTSTPQVNGLFYTLYLDGKEAGFSICLKKSDALKKYSPVFRKVYTIVFDEYQLESREYLKDEILKLQSIIRTVSRGGGELTRETRLILLGNPFDPMNPYFFHFDIWKKISSDTKVLKGDGWVADFSINQESKKEMENSGYSRAFQSDYMKYSATGSYLKDRTDFISNYKGTKHPVFQISYDQKYATIYKTNKNYIYIKEEEKNTNYLHYAFSSDQIDSNTKILKRTNPIFKNIEKLYHSHLVIFSSLIAKEIFFFNFLKKY